MTEFLLANGFGAANMRIATNQLQVFGNRALWTYTCSCSAQATGARVVLNHNRIIVFFMNVAPASANGGGSASGPSLALWVMVVAVLVASALTVRRALHRDRAPPRPRPAQGRLLAGLRAFKDA